MGEESSYPVNRWYLRFRTRAFPVLAQPLVERGGRHAQSASGLLAAYAASKVGLPHLPVAGGALYGRSPEPDAARLRWRDRFWSLDETRAYP